MAYLMGRGHQHTGPGTSMVQFNVPAFNYRGMGACGSCETRDYLGSCCASCAKGSNCSGSCKGGLMGLGLFESGFDVSGWGPLEFGVAAIGGYMILSTVFTTKRAASRIAAYPGERRKRKAARLRARAAELTKKK